MKRNTKTKPLKKRAVKRCYYNDDRCKGKVIAVNSFHKYLCECCLKEYGSINDEVLDHDFSISEW